MTARPKKKATRWVCSWARRWCKLDQLGLLTKVGNQSHSSRCLWLKSSYIVQLCLFIWWAWLFVAGTTTQISKIKQLIAFRSSYTWLDIVDVCKYKIDLHCPNVLCRILPSHNSGDTRLFQQTLIKVCMFPAKRTPFFCQPKLLQTITRLCYGSHVSYFVWQHITANTQTNEAQKLSTPNPGESLDGIRDNPGRTNPSSLR